MNFIPETPKESKSVPFYDDASKADGWQGQATEKSIKALQSEIIEAISLLGGMVMGFQRGSFQTEDGNRQGYRVHYVIEAPDGRQMQGRIDIAALPVKPDTYRSNSFEKRKEASLKMALFMLRIALKGTWFLQQLSPGYSALVPFMLGPNHQTVSEAWAEGVMSSLLPPGESEFVEGVVKEVK